MASNLLNPSLVPDNPPGRAQLTILLIALILVSLGSLYYYLRVTSPALFTDLPSRIATLKKQFTPSPTPLNPTPTPIPKVPYQLPSGTQSYSFSHGQDVQGPKITNVTIDPLDPGQGDTQTITLDLTSDSPVLSSSIMITTDTKSTALALKRTKADGNGGTYQVSWVVDDTYNNTYTFRYQLKNQTATFDNTMYLRQ